MRGGRNSQQSDCYGIKYVNSLWSWLWEILLLSSRSTFSRRGGRISQKSALLWIDIYERIYSCTYLYTYIYMHTRTCIHTYRDIYIYTAIIQQRLPRHGRTRQRRHARWHYICVEISRFVTPMKHYSRQPCMFFFGGGGEGGSTLLHTGQNFPVSHHNNLHARLAIFFGGGKAVSLWQ